MKVKERSNTRLPKIKEVEHLKSCAICGDSFMGTENQDTCWKHSWKPMYTSSEAADEFVYG